MSENIKLIESTSSNKESDTKQSIFPQNFSFSELSMSKIVSFSKLLILVHFKLGCTKGTSEKALDEEREFWNDYIEEVVSKEESSGECISNWGEATEGSRNRGSESSETLSVSYCSPENTSSLPSSSPPCPPHTSSHTQEHTTCSQFPTLTSTTIVENLSHSHFKHIPFSSHKSPFPNNLHTLSLILTVRQILNLRTYEKLFNFYLKSGATQHIFSLYDQIKPFEKSEPRIPFVGKKQKEFNQSHLFQIVLKACCVTRNIGKANDVIFYLKSKDVPIKEALYNLAIECSVRGNRMDSAFNFYKMMTEEHSLIQNTTYSLLIRGYAKTHNISSAIDFFNLMKLQNQEISCSIALNSLLDALIKCDNIPKAIEILNYHLNRQNDGKNAVDLISFSTIIKGFAKQANIGKALELFDLMKKRGIEPDEVLFNSLLDGCSKSGQLTLALEIFNQMACFNIQASVVTYNSLIDASVRSSDLERGWQLLDQMEAKGILPDNFTLSTLIKGIKTEAQTQDLDKAFQLLDRVKKEKLFKPDEILYNVLLDSCIATKQLNKAFELFEKMSLSDSEVVADEISYNTLIKGCSQNRNLHQGLEIFEAMKKSKVGPNEVTYNSIIDLCIRCYRIKKAWYYLSEMKENGIMPDNFTYSTLIKGLKRDSNQSQKSQELELEKAFSLLEDMKRKGAVQPDEILYNCVIDCCIRFHDINRAVAVFNEMMMSNIPPSAITYGILIKAYGQAGQLENAFNAFQKMKESNHKPNSVTYGCLIDACIKNNYVNKALEVFETMNREKIPMNTIIYTTLIKGFAKTQQLDLALKIYERMKEDKKTKPNIVTYNSLLDCAARCNDSDKANEIFMEMKEKNIKPDLITFSTMIKGYCRLNKIGSAFNILEIMKAQKIVPDEVLFNSLLDGCCKCNEIPMAFKVYENMKILQIKPSNVTYSILIKLFGRSRQLDKALEIFEKMKENDVKPGLIVYTCLIKTCIKLKQTKIAIQLFERMKKDNVKPDHITYDTLISGCLQIKKSSEAGDYILDSLKKRMKLKPNLYNFVLEALLSKQDPHSLQKGLEICRVMKNNYQEPDSRIYNSLTKAVYGDKTPNQPPYFQNPFSKFEDQIPINESPNQPEFQTNSSNFRKHNNNSKFKRYNNNTNNTNPQRSYNQNQGYKTFNQFNHFNPPSTNPSPSPNAFQSKPHYPREREASTLTPLSNIDPSTSPSTTPSQPKRIEANSIAELNKICKTSTTHPPLITNTLEEAKHMGNENIDSQNIKSPKKTFIHNPKSRFANFINKTKPAADAASQHKPQMQNNNNKYFKQSNGGDHGKENEQVNEKHKFEAAKFSKSGFHFRNSKRNNNAEPANSAKIARLF